MMRASIVIPSHNERDLLLKTVRSCLETVGDLDCELVVADDASEDGSAEEVAKQFEIVRIAHHCERRGVSATKDLGARNARGDVLLFLDGHCKPEPGAIARLVATVEEWDGNVVVTPSVAPLDPERWECDLDVLGHGFSINLGTCESGWIGLDEMQPVRGPKGGLYYKQPTIIGCCVATGRRLYEELRGFDVGMRSFGSEDLDFGLKSWSLGYPVIHDVEPVIGHRFRDRARNYTVPFEHAYANQLRMVRKHLGDASWSAWIKRFDSVRDQPLWEATWSVFLDGYASLEDERAYLMARRRHDEFWHATEFNLGWPCADTLSPHPILIAGPGHSPAPSSPPPSPGPGQAPKSPHSHTVVAGPGPSPLPPSPAPSPSPKRQAPAVPKPAGPGSPAPSPSPPPSPPPKQSGSASK
jgi:glycosyltransferase involved in cell wall biosynthesis